MESKMGDKKTHMLSLRVTQKQWDYLEEIAERIKQSTGFRITRASIVIKMMEYGLPYLEKEFPKDDFVNKRSA